MKTKTDESVQQDDHEGNAMQGMMAAVALTFILAGGVMTLYYLGQAIINHWCPL